MDERDDPAIRLHEALQRCVEHGLKRGANQAGDIIQGALGAESRSAAAGSLFRLFDETRQGIKALEGMVTVDSYLVHIGPIDTWLGNLNLVHRWDAQADIDDRAMAGLISCSDQLQLGRRFRRLTEDQVELWRLEVRDLLDDVLGADDVPADLRLFLVASLRDILAALETYTITGSARLVEAIENAIGRFADTRPVPTGAAELSRFQKFVLMCSGLSTALHVPGHAVDAAAALRSAYEFFVDDDVELPKELTSGPRALNPPPDESAS